MPLEISDTVLIDHRSISFAGYILLVLNISELIIHIAGSTINDAWLGDPASWAQRLSVFAALSHPIWHILGLRKRDFRSDVGAEFSLILLHRVLGELIIIVLIQLVVLILIMVILNNTVISVYVGWCLLILDWSHAAWVFGGTYSIADILHGVRHVKIPSFQETSSVIELGLTVEGAVLLILVRLILESARAIELVMAPTTSVCGTISGVWISIWMTGVTLLGICPQYSYSMAAARSHFYVRLVVLPYLLLHRLIVVLTFAPLEAVGCRD
jgi:hypothetical protein